MCKGNCLCGFSCFFFLLDFPSCYVHCLLSSADERKCCHWKGEGYVRLLWVRYKLFFSFLLLVFLLVGLLPLLWVITSCWQDPSLLLCLFNICNTARTESVIGELRGLNWSVLLKLMCIMLNGGYLPERFCKIFKENEGANEGLWCLLYRS